MHRPKYDDWSHPKGKLKRGEDTLAAAVREVLEETGRFRWRPKARLGTVRYVAQGRPKEVSYWAAESTGGLLTPNKEVDQIAWLTPPAARTRLTQPRDQLLVDARLDAPAYDVTAVPHGGGSMHCARPPREGPAELTFPPTGLGEQAPELRAEGLDLVEDAMVVRGQERRGEQHPPTLRRMSTGTSSAHQHPRSRSTRGCLGPDEGPPPGPRTHHTPHHGPGTRAPAPRPPPPDGDPSPPDSAPAPRRAPPPHLAGRRPRPAREPRRQTRFTSRSLSPVGRFT